MSKHQINTPTAVLISDIHYSISTLKLADASLLQAVVLADILGVPLIIAGDLHDTKANLRGECVSAIINTLTRCAQTIYIIIGNHDRINEKAPAHSLEFLRPYATIVDSPLWCPEAYAWLLPYYHDPDECIADIKALKTIHLEPNFIMHQGIEGSHSGDYIQDKSAITKQDVAGLRVISGHYHRRQTISLPKDGVWDYIGNPYTTGFGEASDPDKGYSILMSDGRLKFTHSYLRQHHIIECDAELNFSAIFHTTEDLFWIKVTDTKENLMRVTREAVNKKLTGWPFRLDLIPIDTTSQVFTPKNLTQFELLDSLIDSLTNTSDERKTRLKQSWKDLI